MKNLLVLSLMLLVLACGQKQTETAADEPKEWADMDSFHMIMAESFHPYKDSANLDPAKQMAKEMADAAAKWVSNELPGKVNNDAMKAKLQMLNSGSQELLKLVSESAPDSVLGKSLTDLHHTFHEIQEGWYGGGEKKHEHDH